mmetsp:Transcript_21566/g.44285  ORF Transcript_21566/g.44285 Transcript_21566/m.44285 type:complete len:197 (-) Transcript_21566:1618-2208(-)
MKPNADSTGAAGGCASAGSKPSPLRDKLPNMFVVSMAAAATGGVGAAVGEFMNPNEDFCSAGVEVDVAGATTVPDIKSSKLSLAAGAGGAAATGGAGTGVAEGADAMFKPPNKDPPPVLDSIATCGDCWGGGGGAAGAGAAAASSKSNKLATGAGGATAGGAAVALTGGIGAPPTGVATPNRFNTRLAGSRIAARE